MTSLKFVERVALIPRVRTSVTRSWFRWGSEKNREEAELRKLFNEAAEAYITFRKGDGFGRIIDRLPDDELARSLFCTEDHFFAIEAELAHLDLRQAAELRALFCYRKIADDGPALIGRLREDVIDALSLTQRQNLTGDTLVVVGSRAEAAAFPYGYFKWWRLEKNTGRFDLY